MNLKSKLILLIVALIIVFSSNSFAETTDILCGPSFRYRVEYNSSLENGKLNFINGNILIIDSISLHFLHECEGHPEANYTWPLYNWMLNESMWVNGSQYQPDDSLFDVRSFKILSIENPNFIDILYPGDSYDFGRVILEYQDTCCIEGAEPSIFLYHSSNSGMDWNMITALSLTPLVNKDELLDKEAVLYYYKPPYLDNAPVTNKLKITLTLKEERQKIYQELYNNFKIYPKSIIVSDEYDHMEYPINRDFSGYVIEKEVMFIPKNKVYNFYPFDEYNVELNVTGLLLEQIGPEPIGYNEENFDASIEYTSSSVIITKSRPTFTIILYIVLLSVCIYYTYLLCTHFKHPKTNLRASTKKLEILAKIIGILTLFGFSFRPLETLGGTGGFPFLGCLFIIIIAYFYFKSKKNKIS